MDKKHLLIVGKSKTERRTFLNNIISATDKIIYRFPADIRTFDEYIEQVRILFPFIPINWHEQNPKKWTRNQVWDFHLDWTNNSHSILIIIEEFGSMDESWKLEILRAYIMKSYYDEKKKAYKSSFQLIITQEQEENIINQLSEMVSLNEGERRTGIQMVLGKLKVIDLEML
jgi:hypothetical protein